MGRLYSAPRWEFSPPDEVWSQMASYWASTGQLERASITAWDAEGRDEHGFFELGTLASYGEGWELAPWSDEAGRPGRGDWSEVWSSSEVPVVAGGW